MSVEESHMDSKMCVCVMMMSYSSVGDVYRAVIFAVSVSQSLLSSFL